MTFWVCMVWQMKMLITYSEQALLIHYPRDKAATGFECAIVN